MSTVAFEPSRDKLIDWRLTGILSVLFGFHLFHVVTFGLATRFSNSFGGYGGQISLLETVLLAPQYCLPALPAIWAAMAGSARPWRLMLVSLLGLHVVFLVILASVYSPNSIYHIERLARALTGLFLLMLLASLLLFIMRPWGWNIEDIRRRGAENAGTPPDSAPGHSTVGVGRNFQYSLTGMLLWVAGIALVLSVLSTLWMSYAALEANAEDIILTVAGGCGVVVLTPLVLRVTLGETYRTKWLLLILLVGLTALLVFGITFVPPPRPTYYGHESFWQAFMRSVCNACIAPIAWTGLQLLLVRAAGYRFLRVANRPIPIEPSPRLCASARES